MTRFLIQRPISVFITTLAVLFFSGLAYYDLPVSLLPALDVPTIQVRMQWPQHGPAEVEQALMRPLRQRLSNLYGLQDIETIAYPENGIATLHFAYGTDMQLAYVGVTEQTDRLLEVLPPGAKRPMVSRSNIADIPLLQLEVSAKDRQLDIAQVSEVAEKVLRKRLESVAGIAYVGLDGLQGYVYELRPKERMLEAYGIDREQLSAALRAAQVDLGGLSVKEGNYRYYVQLGSRLQSMEALRKLPIHLGEGRAFPLSDLADIVTGPSQSFFRHEYQGEEAVLITLHKQTDYRVTELMPRLDTAVAQLQTDFPSLQIHQTRNQSALLLASVDSLTSAFLYGGAFAFLILFLFLGDYRLPVLVGICIPVSVLMAFLVFYVANISLNIISLSGLALGLGMLIDNAIIVTDNITRQWQADGEGEEALPRLLQACAIGVGEIKPALVSSVLTTLSVFVPLIFLSGLTGALFTEQAIAIAATLGCSLLVAFTLLPVLYFYLFRRKPSPEKLQESRLFSFFLRQYQKSHQALLNTWWAVPLLAVFSLALGYLAWQRLPLQGLPPTANQSVMLVLNWNEPVDVAGNLERVEQLRAAMGSRAVSSSFDIGETQLPMERSLATRRMPGPDRLVAFFELPSPEALNGFSTDLSAWLSVRFPRATFQLQQPPNAFNMIFRDDEPYFEAQLRDGQANAPMPVEATGPWLTLADSLSLRPGLGFLRRTALVLVPDFEALLAADVPFDRFRNSLQSLLKRATVMDLQQTSDFIQVEMAAEPGQINALLQREGFLLSADDPETFVPFAHFVRPVYTEGYRFVTANKNGVYQALRQEVAAGNADELSARFRREAVDSERSTTVGFRGRWLSDQAQFQQLVFIFLVAVALLYFILAAQFESLWQPLLIIATLPIGVSGSLSALWLFGSSVNLMSGIGMVVMLGIIVNDSILKIDTYNRLRKQKPNGESKSSALLAIVHQGSDIRLKPVLMTTFTTILAVAPILFASGLGADLQRPLALAVIGGLAFGTLASLYLIPYLYHRLGR